MAEPPVRVFVLLTAADMVKAVYLRRSSRLLRRLAVILVVLIGVAVAFPVDRWFALGVAFVAVVGGLGTGLVTVAFSASRAARRGSGVEYWVSDTCVFMRGRASESRMSWSAFSRMTKSRAFYELMQTNGVGRIIPRRAFESSDDEARFNEIVQRNIGSGRLTDILGDGVWLATPPEDEQTGADR